ncbi:retrotransposon protein, putative, ty1-copia subclass [Tanacetum coccineum]
MTKSPFTGSCEKGEGLLDLTHTDVCGPFRSAIKDEKHYYVTFTDDFSRYGYVYLIKHKSDTFEVFKSYPEESFGYLLYKPKDNMSADEEPIVNTNTQQEVVTPVKPDDISLPIRRTNGRVRKPPQFYYGFHIEKDKISNSTLSELDEPANYKEAMASLKAAKWKEAMKSEIQFMYDNQVWNSVDTTPSLKTMGCKWIFKKKTNMDGKLDVKTAFLNGKLTEDVFMAQPEGFENAKYHKRVCKLQKAIYGLKQTSHSWNLCFHKKVTQFGFSRSEDESCIYVKVSGSVVVFLVLYVDDILLIGIDILTLQSVKDWLGKCFTMKDLGDATYILVIKIYRDRSKRLIGLSQDTYLDKILKRCKMENSKKGNLPLHHGIKIRESINTKDKFLVYGGEEELRVTGYCNASWQTDKEDSRSQSVCEASKEAIWMKNFIGDLGVVPTVQDPIEILCDNESVVALTKEPKDHGKSKHIEIKYYFVRIKVEEGHSLAVVLDGTLCLVNQDRLRPIIVDDLSKWETIGFSVQAKKESSDKECSTSGSEDEEYAMAVRHIKKFVKRRENALDVATHSILWECPKPLKIRTKRAFVGGSWSDSGEEDDEKVKDEMCLVAHASSEVCSESSYFSDENSSIDDLALDNEYDKLCKHGSKIITKNFIVK